VIPFTAPAVATGIKTGVSTSPCAVVNNPTLAAEWESVWRTSKLLISINV
jgi:hypothetical protein